MKAFYVFLFGSVLFILVGIVASMTGDKGIFLLWLTGSRTTVMDYFFYYITMLGEEYAFIFFGILLWLQSWKKMLTIPVLGIIVSLISFLLKQYFQHERPRLYLERIQWDGPLQVLGYNLITGHNSFPSGHSMAAWALFTLMAAHIKKVWFSILSLFLAVSVSISRIYLMVHFLQDVVAGAMIGISLGFGVYYFYRKWTKNDTLQNQPKSIVSGN